MSSDYYGSIAGEIADQGARAADAPDLGSLSMMLMPRPGPFEARGRLEIVTPGGSSAITMPDIALSRADGLYTATAVAEGLTWSGTADTVTGAVLALLADRIGYRAEVTIKPESDHG